MAAHNCQDISTGTSSGQVLQDILPSLDLPLWFDVWVLEMNNAAVLQ